MWNCFKFRVEGNPVFLNLGIFLVLSLFLSCGQRPEFREYSETTTRSSFGITGGFSGGTVSSQEIDLFNRIKSPLALSSGIAWTTPRGWKEVKETGVRLVSFRTRSDLEVTLIAFPDNVGGIRANLSRWLGQIQVSLSAPELEEMINSLVVETTSDESLSYILVDFESYPPVAEKNQPQTILAGIFGFSDQMLFVKLIGPKEKVSADQVDFIKLVKSIQSRSA